MLKNYLKIAWRNLTQHKSYMFINLSGLAVGMACCLLIALYVREELSFDTFHEYADRIATIGSNTTGFGRMLSTPYPLADALVEEIPQVEQAVRLNGTGHLYLSRDGQEFIEVEDGRYTDPAFFEIFSFELLGGDKAGALRNPNSIVLSESSSRRLFGSENPVGQSLYWQQRDTLVLLDVTGVIENEPQNSSIGYDALVSSTTMSESRRRPDSWRSYSFRTYALLQSPDAFDVMPDQLQTLVEAHYEANDEGEHSRGFFTLPLTELHLSEETREEGFTGNRAYLYLFGSVALFILIIACVNYVNLATARSSLRAKEVGIRKTLGARRFQVAGQFIGESVILSAGAYVLSGCIALLVLPFFNQLFGTSLEWQTSGTFLLWLTVVAAVIGAAAGLYPSAYLSRFSPSSVLRNRSGQASSGSLLRKTLVVAQFTIALVLIIGSLIVYRQLQFTQTKDLGFEGEQVVAVSLPNRDAWNRRETIRDNLAGHPGILEISAASGSPGEFNIRMSYKPEDWSSEEQVETENNTVTFAPAVVDYNFLELLDIELIAGRNFSREMSSDEDRAYILNRKAAELLGWSPGEAVGRSFGTGKNPGNVIGVVENFHISSLHNEIEGIVLQLHESSSWYSGGTILAKLAPDRISETMDFIEKEVKPFSPNTSFDYEFLDDRFDAMYRTERRFGRIVSLFTVIAIIIACLGLYGLAAFSAERRTKEIGIRKVLGATVSNIVTLLSKDFLKLVVLGYLIAVPVAWYVMNRWLEDFAYRTEIGPAIFLLAGAAAVFIALATVSWQSVRAAVANPVESLRSE